MGGVKPEGCLDVVDAALFVFLRRAFLKVPDEERIDGLRARRAHGRLNRGRSEELMMAK